MIQAELRIATGKQQGNSIPLPQGKFLVGREEDCHLRPNSDLVSRHHCVFTVDDFSVRLRDLGSTNGTFVNGERLKGAVILKAGDRVLIGKLDFEVTIREGAAAAPGPSSVDTVMIAGSPEAASASTQFAMPVVDLTGNPVPAAPPAPGPAAQSPAAPSPALVADASAVIPPPTGDTQMLSQQPGMVPPGYGMPVGYPQQPYMQAPYGYPGYAPQMPQMPMGGYYGQPMGYPQMPMQMPMGQMMPGYGMPQQMPMAEPEQAAAAPTESIGVRLPDPSATGAKEPPPPAPQPAAVAGAPAVHIPTAAADIIKQYMNRR